MKTTAEHRGWRYWIFQSREQALKVWFWLTYPFAFLRGWPRLGAINRIVIAPQDLRTSDPTAASDIYSGYFSFAGKALSSGGRSPFSLASVPQFILLGVGLYSFAELLPKAEKVIRGLIPLQVVYAVVPTIALMAANIPQSYDFVMDAETAVRDVHQRVRYMTGVQKKLGLDYVKLLDVDMGAHLWYTNWYII